MIESLNSFIWVFNFMENWIDCKGFESVYMVSDLGNVKSLSRYIENGNGGYISKEKVLKQTKNKQNKYFFISLCINSKPKKVNVHQLVAINFLGLIPDGTNKIVVDHIDGNRQNNSLINLNLISNRENTTKESKGVSKYIGVSWHKSSKSWRSAIRVNGKRKESYFKNEIDAHHSYQNELSKIC